MKEKKELACQALMDIDESYEREDREALGFNRTDFPSTLARELPGGIAKKIFKAVGE